MITARPLFLDAAIGSDSSILEDIHQESKSIAIYERDIESLSTDLRQLRETTIDCRASGTADEIKDFITSYFHNQHSEFCQDVSQLLRLFAEVSRESSFRVFLGTVETDMCRKFHTDLNGLRLLCTYLGPGTMWVPDEAINNDAFRNDHQDVIHDENLVRQASAGDVLILKGALYQEPNPILHRSPPIEKKNEKRILLRIDTNASLKLWT